MEQIIRVANTTLTATEQSLYSNVAGAVITKVIMYNSNTTASNVTLSIDSVIFLFNLGIGETKILDLYTLVNDLKATGDKVNIHISGIQMEVTS